MTRPLSTFPGQSNIPYQLFIGATPDRDLRSPVANTMRRKRVTNDSSQRGPIGFDRRAILQKRGYLRGTSNKMMCKATDSRFKIEKGR